MNAIFKIAAIGFNVWRETLRNKGLFTLISFFILLLISSHGIDAAAMINSSRIVQTMGLFLFGLFGILSNIYMGNLFIQEIRKKQLNVILVRPISRTLFLSGKFFGILLVLMSIFLTASSVWLLILKINQVAIAQAHYWALVFLFGEWMVIASASLLFAVFTSPLLHGFFVFFFAFFGHYSKDLIVYSATQANLALKQLILWLYYAIPNLELVNFRRQMLYDQAITIQNLTTGGILVLLWTLVLFTGASVIFSKRNLY